MKVKEIIQSLGEAVYHGNVGIMELHRFNEVASNKQKAMMKKFIASNDWASFKRLIADVLNVELD